MKTFLMTFALLAVSNIASATNYSFKQSQFNLKGTIKNAKTNTSTPIFNLNGSAIWTEDADDTYGSPKAQITIRRTTYDCDDVNYSYNDDYSCEIQGDKFQQILEDLVTHDDDFTVAQGIIKRYFDDASYYESVKIPLGKLNQVGETSDSKELTDPSDENMSVDVEMTTTGMEPLENPL